MAVVPNWTDIDWDQPRPSIAEVVSSWRGLEWEPNPIESGLMDAYLTQVRETHVIGGYLIGRWRATQYNDVTAWFAARHRFGEYELYRLLFDHPVVRRDLAALEIPEHLDRMPGGLEEVYGGALTLDGILATIIVNGGAYEEFSGSWAQAKHLADEAVADVTGRRYEDFRLHQTSEAWTPWFLDVVWDHTLVLTDSRNEEVTVLCITDED